ncbi:MAG TPA: insulinase family protein, partial [Polyangia bacterium]
VSGNVDVPTVEQVAQTLFGGWTVAAGGDGDARRAALVASADASKAEDRERVFYIPQKGATQTTVVVGRKGLALTHPQHYLLRLVTGRAPAGASAWLRGVEQVTYGVSSIGDANTVTGYFGARLSVDTPSTALALESIVSRYGARLPGNFDIEKVVLLATEGMTFYSLAGRTRAVARQHIAGQPLDHFAQLRQRIDDQRVAEVETVTDDFIDDDSMQVVLVGDEAALRGQIPGTRLGELTPLDLAAKH